MKQSIGVECTIEKDGAVKVRRIEVGDRWLAVEQGRQWADENGRHVLIMVPGLLVFTTFSDYLNFLLTSGRVSATRIWICRILALIQARWFISPTIGQLLHLPM